MHRLFCQYFRGKILNISNKDLIEELLKIEQPKVKVDKAY